MNLAVALTAVIVGSLAALSWVILSCILGVTGIALLFTEPAAGFLYLAGCGLLLSLTGGLRDHIIEGFAAAMKLMEEE